MVLWLSEVFLSNNLEKRHPLGTGFLGKKRILDCRLDSLGETCVSLNTAVFGS